jgi:dTDP-4-dehydrorhamnose 3,5-epimerase-like enzyme
MKPIPVQFPRRAGSLGVLSVYESGREVPFEIRRVFTVSAPKSNVRGEHAHEQCTQLFVCVAGMITVTCDDGRGSSQWVLNDISKGLLVPPGVWAKQEYMTDGAVLMVLCDRGYDATDYIRDHAEIQNAHECRH